MSLAILWLRRDLRLRDNPALNHAAAEFDRLIPLFIDHDLDDWAPGEASNWWLHHSLEALGDALDGKLWLRRGDPLEILRDLAERHEASAVFWNRCYEPAEIERDKRVKAELGDDGLEVASFNALLCAEPWRVKTKTETPYRVFTPYYRTWRDQRDQPETTEAPSLELLDDPNPVALEDLHYKPAISWDEGFYEHWQPGEEGALQALDEFLDALEAYHEDRDRPDHEGTSRLSPHLHFGEIAPWRVIATVDGRDGDEPFVRELAWREFSYQMLFHFPETTTEPLNDRFVDFPWGDDEELLEAWRRGQTGIPIVDAGMRQLWHTGWMHNRVRMIVASLLTKNLLCHWIHGARWFFDTLVDADLASNTQGWQWAAGSGADAAPYFRIFNPIRQGERFDPNAAYVKRWVPELKELDPKYAHAPWDAPALALSKAGIELGDDYPKPVVDLKESRQRALDAYDKVKG